MTAILVSMAALVAALISIQKPIGAPIGSANTARFLPCPQTQPSKYAYEMFCLYYSPLWMTAFAVVVVFQLYESFTAQTYNLFCGFLALPLLLQPILFPSGGFHSPDSSRPWYQRYSFKANIWLAIYSFIGNYWYTHYFYSVLKASYTMPATRLNNVPLAFYFATHFYFSSYHLFSNACLRKVKTSYEEGWLRTALYLSVVSVLSYFTAFMETLTISAFPYYSFQDRYMAYTVGSAFYGIYFMVSFPAFVAFDENIDTPMSETKTTTGSVKPGNHGISLWETIVQSCGYGMMILCLLDFVRLYIGVPLIVGA
jgi:cycloeucalenol cycloisomerase